MTALTSKMDSIHERLEIINRRIAAAESEREKEGASDQQRSELLTLIVALVNRATALTNEEVELVKLAAGMSCVAVKSPSEFLLIFPIIRDS